MSGKAKKKNAGSWLLIRMLAVILVFLLCFAVIWTWELSQPKPNPYTSENFAYVNGYLTCKTEKSALGIDVSRYQGEIDWQKVREAGVEFAFIRLGYRSSGDGKLSEDVMARKNLQGALAAGLEVGGYVFSQAMTPEEAREEAALAVSVVKDYKITYPVAFDMEYIPNDTARIDKLSKIQITKQTTDSRDKNSKLQRYLESHPFMSKDKKLVNATLKISKSENPRDDILGEIFECFGGRVRIREEAERFSWEEYYVAENVSASAEEIITFALMHANRVELISDKTDLKVLRGVLRKTGVSLSEKYLKTPEDKYLAEVDKCSDTGIFAEYHRKFSVPGFDLSKRTEHRSLDLKYLSLRNI